MLCPSEGWTPRQVYDALPLQFNKLLFPNLLMAVFQSNTYRKNSLIGSEGQRHSQAIENGKHSNFTEQKCEGTIRCVIKGCFYLLDCQDVDIPTYIQTQWKIFFFIFNVIWHVALKHEKHCSFLRKIKEIAPNLEVILKCCFPPILNIMLNIKHLIIFKIALKN